jgi:hypothetical protein
MDPLPREERKKHDKGLGDPDSDSNPKVDLIQHSTEEGEKT